MEIVIRKPPAIDWCDQCRTWHVEPHIKLTPPDPPGRSKITCVTENDCKQFQSCSIDNARRWTEAGWDVVATIKRDDTPIAVVLHWAHRGEPIVPEYE